jgi:hypothetical protein
MLIIIYKTDLEPKKFKEERNKIFLEKYKKKEKKEKNKLRKEKKKKQKKNDNENEKKKNLGERKEEK